MNKMSEMSKNLSIAVATWLICSAVALSAQAQEPSGSQDTSADAEKSAQLKQLVGEASAAYGEGDYETAVVKLLDAYWIEPNARLLYNTARSYEELGECRLALVYYRSFSQQDGAESSLVSKAKKKLAKARECDDYSPALSGRLSVFTQPAGAAVIVDGRQVGTTPTEVAGLTSGEHKVSVELEGYKSASNTLDLKAGQDREVRATLVEAPDADAISAADLTGDGQGGANAVAEPSSPPEASGSGVSIPAVAMVGAGVVGLGVGTYFDLVAIPDTDDERSGYAPDSTRYAELTDTRSSQATGALVGYIGGGALLAAGTTWLLLDLIGEKSNEASALRPTAAPKKDGFVAGFEWWF